MRFAGSGAAFGGDFSRYIDNKRAVENTYSGPVKTEMTRCIHCTRWVRFTAEVAGTGDMGAIGRGEDMEITTYLQSAMTSNCRVMFLTFVLLGRCCPTQNFARARGNIRRRKASTFRTRSALRSGSTLRGREVIRILPRVNDAVNEEWIS